MPFPLFPLQVTSGSRDESSGPRLMPLLLIKMINKSRESHGGAVGGGWVPSPSFPAGMRVLGDLHMEIWLWGSMLLCCGSSWVMEYWGIMGEVAVGRVILGSLILWAQAPGSPWALRY